MQDPASNPFNITKAVDFSDQEIADYWVDIPAGTGFVAMAKPTSPMPMLILGGKGSGKTHLMRYFSYPLQRIRHGDELLQGVAGDGYIGIYLRCGGLNSARFRGKGLAEEVWADVFAYYMELWLSQFVLTTVLDVVSHTPGHAAIEPAVLAELLPLIDLRGSPPPATLLDLRGTLRDLQQHLDTAINNAAISRQLPVHIAVTRGDLIFGLPRSLALHVPTFAHCLFVYLLDEFENLSSDQQKYVNTLLREQRSPCSFKIGARMYGVRTLTTYSADEENKEGSEFEVLRLDARLRENDEQYGAFAKRLIAKRLAESRGVRSDPATLDAMASTLDAGFEEPAKSRFHSAETAYIQQKYRERERPYFDACRQHLAQGLQARVTVGVREPADVEVVLRSLRCPEFPLLEKANLFLFYQDWSRKRDLVKAAAEIAGQCGRYVAGEKVERYSRKLEHFKADLLAQLYRDTDQRQRYLGLGTFIEISSGLPRNLLIILKQVFAWATFNGETPFGDRPISIRSQQDGVSEGSEWFYRDARMIGRDGQLVIDSVARLGTLFRGIRFSDKPSECSCSTFSVDLSRCTEDARRVLDLAEKWSLLIDVGGHRDKNTKRVDAKFQLNPMLSPRWDLAIYRRGVIALTPPEVDAIFDPTKAGGFDGYCQARLARMQAPFFGSRTATSDPHDAMPLFSGQDDD